jgi:hypothetical protein
MAAQILTRGVAIVLIILAGPVAAGEKQALPKPDPTLLKENQRLLEEIRQLQETIKQLQALNLTLEAAMKQSRIQAFNNEQLAKSRQQQLERILEQLREITGGRTVPEKNKGLIGDPRQANPPSVPVKGVIENIERSGNSVLVKVSLGKDHGVEKGHTLEIYRLQPSPQYLGMIRIVEAEMHTSIGRFVTAPGKGPTELKIGDKVTSSISR